MRHDNTSHLLQSIPVEDLDLTVSTWKTLKKNHIKTIADLLSLTRKKRWAARLRIGRKSTFEIAGSLSDLNLAGTREILLASGLPIKDLARPVNPLAETMLHCKKMPAMDISGDPISC